MKNNILFVGPIRPVHGQSNAMRFLIKSFNIKKTNYFDTQKISNKLLNTVYSIIFLSFKILFSKYNKIYLSGSRSRNGIFKDLPVYLFKDLLNYEIINHVHGFSIEVMNKNNVIDKFLFNQYRKSDKLIVLNENHIKENRFFYKKKTVINNYYHPIFEKEIKVKINNKAIYLSNLMFSKGILNFMDLALYCSVNNIEYEFHVIGKFCADDFMSEKKIKNMFFEMLKKCNSYGKQNIHYHGALEQERIASLLSKSDIMILPTFYKTEALPLSLIEALRSGNAIITTSHNFLQNIFSNKNGRIIKKQCSEELIKAFLKLSNDKNNQIRIRSNNITFAKKMFNPKNHLFEVKKILNL